MSESESADPGAESAASQEEEGQEEGQQTEGQETEGQEGKTPEGEGITEKYQSAIDKQHAKYQDEKRDHGTTRQQLEDAQARIAELAPAPTLMQVPDLPEQYDDDYAEQMNRRDQIITHNAQVNAQATFNEQTAAANLKTSPRTRLADLQTKADVYTDKAKEFNITPEELSAAAGVVQSYNIPPELTEGLLTDPDGPLLTKYLAANPLELDALRGMNPFQAATHIQTNIRAKAQALAPKGTKTGAPPDELPSGGGADPDANKYPNSKGATFT